MITYSKNKYKQMFAFVLTQSNECDIMNMQTNECAEVKYTRGSTESVSRQLWYGKTLHVSNSQQWQGFPAEP